MNKIGRHPLLAMTLGVALGIGFMALKPQKPLHAESAHGNDKFSMATVPVTIGETEAVFALDHLTGVLRGAYLNTQSGGFSHSYQRNVAADFQINPATPDPKYVIVSATAQLRSSGGVQPANGILYVGELTSGTVIAYGFAMPRGRGAPAPAELVRLDAFSFREAIR